MVLVARDSMPRSGRGADDPAGKADSGGLCVFKRQPPCEIQCFRQTLRGQSGARRDCPQPETGQPTCWVEEGVGAGRGCIAGIAEGGVGDGVFCQRMNWQTLPSELTFWHVATMRPRLPFAFDWQRLYATKRPQLTQQTPSTCSDMIS